MGPLVALLLMIGIFVLAIYFRFQPQVSNKKPVAVYNWMVLGVCAFLCGAWVLHVQTALMGTVDEKWIKPFAIGGALAIEIVLLAVCLVLRNFWIFRPPRKAGGNPFG